jgi:hypothetical protein
MKKKLTVESSPEDWVEKLLQDKRKPTDPRHVVTISEWTNYSNAKAMLSNAGQKGGIYTEFTPFSPQEIKSFFGLYVLHGQTPSPQIKMKIKSQLEDPVCGRDICHAVFRKKCRKKRHKHFKAFFACQDLIIGMNMKAPNVANWR